MDLVYPIEVFQDEIENGLAELIQKNSTISSEMEAKPSKQSLSLKESFSKASHVHLDDLYFLDAILASTGLNLNDDFFGNEETFSAKDTPINKPFDYEHKSGDIIGHIVSCDLADFDGNTIDLAKLDGKIPDTFEIPFTAALYKHYFDNKSKQERIDSIIAAINNPTDDDRWFVSMECRFKGFNYVIFPENQAFSSENSKFIERNQDTAFLTKHLRAYGGSGVYKGNRVGRFLKNIVFSGVGLVRKPGNPRSVILARSSGTTSGKIEDVFQTLGYYKNSEEIMEKLQEEVNNLKAQLEVANKKLVEVDKTNFEKQVADLKVEVESLTAKLEASKAELDVAKKEFDKVVASEKEAKEQLSKFQIEAEKTEAARKEADRLSKVKEAYSLASDEDAKKFATPLSALTDEAFAAHLEVIKGFKTPVKVEKTDAAAALETATPVKEPDGVVPVVEETVNELQAELVDFFNLGEKTQETAKASKSKKKK